jgi:hypothetical protein
MKKILLIFLTFLPAGLFAQQNGGWTAEQQDQFRKQMEDFRVQMQDEMQMLRDSLNNMQEEMKGMDWSQFDSMHFEFPGMPSMPESDAMDDIPNMDVIAADDSTRVRVGRWNVIVDDGRDGEDHVRIYKQKDCDEEDQDDHELKDVETKFLLLDVGVNNYFAKGFSSDFPAGYGSFNPDPGKSWVVNIHAVDQRLNLIHYRLWLTYGAYFELNSYKYETDQVIVPKIDSVAFATTDGSLKKNKLSCEYVGIPLMLRYESNPHDANRSFHISGGAFGEYLIGAHTKTKSDAGKQKVHDDFNLNRFRYGIAGRVGYGWLNLFANIGLSELLVEGAGPILYPFSAGLAFEF